MTNEDKRFEQLRFERKFIVIPYLIYAVIVLLLNIFYSDLKNNNDIIRTFLCV